MNKEIYSNSAPINESVDFPSCRFIGAVQFITMC